MVNLVAIQMVSGPEPEQNLADVGKQLSILQPAADSLVVLPECFSRFGCADKQQLANAEEAGNGPVQTGLSQLAAQYQVYIVGGTMPIQAPEKDKFHAASLLFAPSGERIARYNKIHLFDVEVDDNTRSYLESRYTAPGEDVVVADTGIGRVGMAVCYDLRFAGLFDAMGEVDVMVLPSAFTKVTGEAHWHALVRARAIEHQCYVVAPNQGGTHNNGRETYGHSMIVSPWGEVLAECEKGADAISVEADWSESQRLRKKMPVAEHNRFRSQLIESR